MDDDLVLALLHETADAVGAALGEVRDWGRSGRPGQYQSDVAADRAALAVLDAAGVGVLSEESGVRRPDHPLRVVVDPLDGSTNAFHRIPWYATSLCAVDRDGPVVALVVDLVHGTRFEAVREAGARRDGVAIEPSGCDRLADGVVGLAGLPPAHLGWRQFRALGAAALDLCAVAEGRLDAWIDCGTDAHGPWDYLAGLLVCREAGAAVADLHGRDLVAREHHDRRTPVAAATPSLLDEAISALRAGYAG